MVHVSAFSDQEGSGGGCVGATGQDSADSWLESRRASAHVVKQEIKEATIVVCVTNAIGSILEADDFGPHTVVLDDAQPENVDQAVLVARPDIRVVKCLARIPGLSCPFDMRLFTRKNRDEEVTFTCLAETGRRATLPVVRHRRSHRRAIRLYSSERRSGIE